MHSQGELPHLHDGVRAGATLVRSIFVCERSTCSDAKGRARPLAMVGFCDPPRGYAGSDEVSLDTREVISLTFYRGLRSSSLCVPKRNRTAILPSISNEICQDLSGRTSILKIVGFG